MFVRSRRKNRMAVYRITLTALNCSQCHYIWRAFDASRFPSQLRTVIIAMSFPPELFKQSARFVISQTGSIVSAAERCSFNECNEEFYAVSAPGNELLAYYRHEVFFYTNLRAWSSNFFLLFGYSLDRDKRIFPTIGTDETVERIGRNKRLLRSRDSSEYIFLLSNFPLECSIGKEFIPPIASLPTGSSTIVPPRKTVCNNGVHRRL